MSFWLSNRFKNCDLSKVQVFMFINKIILRILTGKTPSNKTPSLRKSTNMGVWAVYTKSIIYKRFLNRNKTFKKIK